MDKPLYFDDCYLKDWDATVVSITDDKFVVIQNSFIQSN